MRRLLRLPAYRRLLTAYTLNELAWGFGTVTLSYLVYRRTGSAAGAAGFYLCAQIVPALVAPGVVGQIDQLPPRAILPVLYGIESVLFLGLGVVASHFSLVLVLVLALLDGTLALTARPLARATTAAVTAPEGLLREANALNNMAFSVAFMAGPALGGLVVSLGGASLSLFIDAGVFLAMSLILLTARVLPGSRPAEPHQGGRVRAAWAYTRERPVIGRLLVLQGIAVVFFTISVPVEVVYARHQLGAGAGGYGILLAAWGGGAVVGSAAYARWRELPSRMLVSLASGALGAGLCGMALAPSLGPAIAAAAVAGVGNGVEVVAVRTALQELLEERWMAIVLSFNESISEASPGVGIVLGGVLATVADSRVALAAGGVGALGVAVVAWAMLSPLHELRPATDPPPV